MKIYERKLEISSEPCLQIIKLIRSNGHAARIIGGAVRDTIIGHNAHDFDIATTLKPNELMELLKSHGIKAIPTGIDYGTITALSKQEAIEITTLRKDIKCFGRKVEVEFSNDFAEDAQRRDFTINALSYCPIEQKIYDYFDGMQDLKNGKVRFIGLPAERIKEDYLRILRFMRFSLRFAHDIDKDGFNACVQHQDQLTQLSKERIKLEMDSILTHKNSVHICELMHNSGMLSVLYPTMSYDTTLHTKILQLIGQHPIADSHLLCYGALFAKSSEVNIDSFLKLKFSKKEAQTALHLIEVLHAEKEHLPVILGRLYLKHTNYIIYFLMAMAVHGTNAIKLLLHKYEARTSKPKMPINGRDLMALGIKNEKLKYYLNKLEDEWIKSYFTLSRQQILNKIKHD